MCARFVLSAVGHVPRELPPSEYGMVGCRPRLGWTPKVKLPSTHVS